MSTLAKPAFGYLLQMSDAAGANHQTIAELKDINWDLQAKTEEGTVHNSGVPWEVLVPTILSQGVDFMVNYVPAAATHNSTTGLMYVFQNRQSRNWKIVDPDVGELASFDAFITGFKGGFPVAGLKSGSITLKGNGAPTFAI